MPEPTRPALALIAALTSNRVIGRDGAMPWTIPADLAYFRRITLGHTVIMGRRTWASLGKPLPGRRNIVVTSDTAPRYAGAEVVRSLEAAMALCANEKLVFCIGGGALYRAALPFTTNLFLTEIQVELAGDTSFPDVDVTEWRCLYRERWVQAEAPHRFEFVLYARKCARHVQPAGVAQPYSSSYLAQAA